MTGAPSAGKYWTTQAVPVVWVCGGAGAERYLERHRSMFNTDDGCERRPPRLFKGRRQVSTGNDMDTAHGAAFSRAAVNAFRGRLGNEKEEGRP